MKKKPSTMPKKVFNLALLLVLAACSKPAPHHRLQADAPVMEVFSTIRGQVVTLYIASSFISAEQARLNLNEALDRPFDEVRDAA